jgi:hypothetical protein
MTKNIHDHNCTNRGGYTGEGAHGLDNLDRMDRLCNNTITGCEGTEAYNRAAGRIFVTPRIFPMNIIAKSTLWLGGP